MCICVSYVCVCVCLRNRYCIHLPRQLPVLFLTPSPQYSTRASLRTCAGVRERERAWLLFCVFPKYSMCSEKKTQPSRGAPPLWPETPLNATSGALGSHGYFCSLRLL